MAMWYWQGNNLDIWATFDKGEYVKVDETSFFRVLKNFNLKWAIQELFCNSYHKTIQPVLDEYLGKLTPEKECEMDFAKQTARNVAIQTVQNDLFNLLEENGYIEIIRPRYYDRFDFESFVKDCIETFGPPLGEI